MADEGDVAAGRRVAAIGLAAIGGFAMGIMEDRGWPLHLASVAVPGVFAGVAGRATILPSAASLSASMIVAAIVTGRLTLCPFVVGWASLQGIAMAVVALVISDVAALIRHLCAGRRNRRGRSDRGGPE